MSLQHSHVILVSGYPVLKTVNWQQHGSKGDIYICFHDRVNIRIYIQTGVCVVVFIWSNSSFSFASTSLAYIIYHTQKPKKKTKITWDKKLTTTYAFTDDIAQPKFLGCIDNQILIHMVLCSTLQVQELCYQCYKI